ncbi:MAG: hypothetical protein ACE5R3_07480 [Nitrosopumilaceae archaeon]
MAGMFVGSIPAYAGSAASSAIMQYEKGMISEAELEQRLQDIGYSNEEIRQVKAVSGGLEHQQDDYVPQSQSMVKNTVESNPEKTSNVSANEADNIMLVMGIGGAATVAAITIAFSKKALTS